MRSRSGMRSQATNGHAVPVTRIVGFARLLRANGIAGSPAEIVDALKAVEAMPLVLQTRAAFSATLASTLVKRVADFQTFETLFALWFDAQQPAHLDDDHRHNKRAQAQVAGVDLLPTPGSAMDAGRARHEHGKRIDLRRYFGEGVARPEHDHHAEDRLKITWMGSELEYDQTAARPPAGLEHDGSFGLRRVTTSGLPGRLRPPSSVEIPRAIVLNSL